MIAPKTWAAAGGAGAASAVTTIVVWMVKTYGHQDIPVEVAGSLTTLLSAAGAFAAAYFAPHTKVVK